MEFDLDFDKVKSILKKDIDNKSTKEILSFLQSNIRTALSLLEIEGCEHFSSLEKTKVLLSLGLGTERTLHTLSEFKINRDHTKEAKESMNEEQTEFRIKNEKIITNLKINSTKRKKRMNIFKQSGAKWEDIAERYSNSEPTHKLSKEYNLKSHVITEQLKDDGLYDESRSTLLKRDKAIKLEKTIDSNFIIQLVKDNPLDSKDLWWIKAKKKYPWLLRRQMFSKLEELGLERTKEEENLLRSIKNIEFMDEFKPEEIYALGPQQKKEKEISSHAIKANTMKKIEKVFGSTEKLVKFYMSGKLGSYSKVADYINKNASEGIKVSTRQVEKAITRHPSYTPRQSYPEKQLLQYVTSTFPDFTVVREKQIPGTMKRMDVFIEELKVGLEFNGDYFHSDEVVLYNYGKSSEEHHKERVEDAKKAGIKLVYVWERDWSINFLEVEKAIVNQDWDNPILNRHSNSDYYRKIKTPNPEKSTSRKKQDSN